MNGGCFLQVLVRLPFRDDSEKLNVKPFLVEIGQEFQTQ